MALPHSLQWEIDRIPRNRKITHGPGLSRFAVDGIEPEAAVFPNTIEEVSHLLSAADWDGKAVVQWGGGTAIELGNRARGCDLGIGTSRLNRVLEYEPSDLTVVVQFLPLDPPYSDRATIGGILPETEVAIPTAETRVMDYFSMTVGTILNQSPGEKRRGMA